MILVKSMANQGKSNLQTLKISFFFFTFIC